MKKLFLPLLFLAGALSAQNYPFLNAFVPAEIIHRDGSSQKGFIDWQMHMGRDLRFKSAMNEVPIKIKPSDILMFRTDSLEFKTMKNVRVYAMPYVRLGTRSKLNRTFAEVIHRGRYNIYRVTAIIRDPIDGDQVKTINYLFEFGEELAAYPEGLQLSTSKLKKVKKDLLDMFEAYPAVINEIQYHDWQEPLDGILSEVKKL